MGVETREMALPSPLRNDNALLLAPGLNERGKFKNKQNKPSISLKTKHPFRKVAR
jgi:hypothetical protein